MNQIGTNSAGTAALANSNDGIFIETNDTTIGSEGAGAYHHLGQFGLWH